MSRRHASTLRHMRSLRVLAGSLIAVLTLSLALPGRLVLGQEDTISDQAVQQRWQLLTYRDAEGEVVPVPAGIGATLQLFSNSAFGESACSEYTTSYTRQRDSIFFDPPTIDAIACDPASQAFDDAFYQALGDTASLTVTPSILALNDVVGEPLMTLTRATIDADPTVARWDLARIGAADGSIEPVIQGLNPWIEFLRGGRVVGDTGCGSFYGSYDVNDGTMRVSDVAFRLTSCSDAARRQAEAIIASLPDITDFDVLPAGMALRDEGGATRLALVPDIDLGDRTWTPIDIIGPDGESVFEEDRLNTSAVKLFGRRAEGRSICRYFSGRSITSGLALSIDPLGLEGNACNKRLTEVEDAFIASLEAAASMALRGAELELKDVDGRTLMRLLPQAELVGPTWELVSINRQPNRARPARNKVNGQPPLALFEDIEVVSGDTGAGNNVYVAAYRTPAASRIDISDVEVTGRGCNNARKRSRPGCKQESLYLALLERADSYIVREGELRLLEGNKPLLWFAPEVLDTTEEE